MGSFLVRLGDKIVNWSTVVDAPTDIFDDGDDVRAWTKDEYGNEGLERLPERLERLRAKGTSSHYAHSAEDAVSCNRAGKNETKLTFDQLVSYFGVERDHYDDPPEGVPFDGDAEDDGA